MPSRTRQIVRRVDPRAVADFDDQLWPINCAILILAGFAAGVAVATGQWHAESLLHNTIFRLVLVALAVGVAFAAVALLEGRVVRRVQLCVIISLLVHLWLGLVLYQQYIVMVATQREADAAQPVPKDDPRQIVPEYHWENVERPESRHTFEEPVEVEAPRPTDPQPPEPRRIEHHVPLDKEPTTRPESPEPQQPNPAELRRAELTAPRRAVLAAGSQISKQPWKSLPEPNEPIPEPEATAELAPRPEALPTEVASPAHRPSGAAHVERELFESIPEAARAEATAQLARRASPQRPLADVPTTPTPTRRVREAAELARVEPPEPAAIAPHDMIRELSEPKRRATALTRTQAGQAAPARAEPGGQALPRRAEVVAAVAYSPARSDASPELGQDVANRPVARSGVRGGASAASEVAGLIPGPPATPAASPQTTARLEAKWPARSARRGGSAYAMPERPNLGAGSEASRRGGPERIGAAQLARTARNESFPSAVVAGGSLSPARQAGLTIAPADTLDVPEVAIAAPAGREPGGAPAAARTPHERHGRSGLPDGLARGGADGAPTSIARRGGPVTAALAHRAAAASAETGGPAEVEGRGTLGRTTSDVRLPTGTVALGDLPPEAREAASPSALAAPSTPAGLAGTAGPGHVVAPGEVARDAAHDQTLPVGLAASTPGVATGPRRLPSGEAPTAALAAPLGGALVRKADAPGLLRGLAETVADVPAAVAGPARSAGEVTLTAGLEDAAPMHRPGGLPVEIAAKSGPGGLSYEASVEVGIPSRRARPESEVVHAQQRRFLVERSGGRWALDGRVVDMPAEAFRQRDPGRRARAVEIYGGTEGTERAVEMGLDFLVRFQFPDGHWSLARRPEGTVTDGDDALGQMDSDAAATGLALLSFFGAGYTHQSDKHRDVVRRGLDWLLAHQKPDGDLFTGGTSYARLYSHGIAAIALCEAYGMTRDPRLREPAQRAVRFIVEAQHPTRGGWRYEPGVESDTSVSGWQLMALKSAQMAGLAVPRETLAGVSGWLDLAGSQSGARYAYNPYASATAEQRDGRRPNLAMTAEGALMRMYLGWSNRHPALVAAAEHLAENLPEVGTASAPSRDAYYWYYATQVMFQMQGRHWDAWNARLHPLLESSQVQTGPMAGSWHPTHPIRDRWGHAGGRLYVTTMHLLMLEVYYRHLPLFRTLEGER